MREAALKKIKKNRDREMKTLTFTLSLLFLSTMSRGNMDEFDEFDDEFDEFDQSNVVRSEIKNNNDYDDPIPEMLPRKRHDILIQFCSS